ncbi:MAG: nitroreductase family protein [Candidatus Omnitrophica bacterium]|nr:nitroreductase family protein [Candidatus Omnitrophota bacterium]MBU2044711.1 nitroreductase family protein [Candidatus Omnitrophota bacterium]MBU2473480.1 nitroreductase family protein [Candidatus Omnitrophota bacterium]
MQNQLQKLITTRRSIRLFKQRPVSLAAIKRAVNAGRLAPSAANLQFIEYLAVNKPKPCQKIFPLTRWAGYLYPKRMPPLGKRPTAYIIILANQKKSPNPDLRDVGAAAENIILSLLAEGIGSCWIASIDKEALRKIFKIPKIYLIDSLIACGYSDEKPKLETDSKKVKYWLDKKGRLHVPKRPLKDILHFK